MNTRRPFWLLLSLALLLGQSLTLAHAAEHISPQSDDGICVLCLQTHNLKQAQHSNVITINVVSCAVQPAETSETYTAQPHRLGNNIRAPPHPVA